MNREDEARAKAECVRKLSLHRISKAKHTYDGSAVANSSDGEAGREDGSRGGGDGSTSRETEGSTRARLVTKEVTSSHQPSQRETIPTNNSASLTLQPLIHEMSKSLDVIERTSYMETFSGLPAAHLQVSPPPRYLAPNTHPASWADQQAI